MSAILFQITPAEARTLLACEIGIDKLQDHHVHVELPAPAALQGLVGRGFIDQDGDLTPLGYAVWALLDALAEQLGVMDGQG